MTSTTTAPHGPSVRLDGESMAAAKRRLGYQPHGQGFDDKRGSSADRRARVLKILGAMPIKRGPAPEFVGNGRSVQCVYGCGTELTYVTLTVDRKDPFGTYEITNVRGACKRCNEARGTNETWTYNPKIHNWGPNSLVTDKPILDTVAVRKIK